jgi:hypothetical protein
MRTLASVGCWCAHRHLPALPAVWHEGEVARLHDQVITWGQRMFVVVDYSKTTAGAEVRRVPAGRPDRDTFSGGEIVSLEPFI